MSVIFLNKYNGFGSICVCVCYCVLLVCLSLFVSFKRRRFVRVFRVCVFVCFVIVYFVFEFF